jgi:integrase/recombinase XerD
MFRRPRIDYESHAIGLDRNEAGALLVAAGLGPAAEHALISLLALYGLRVSEAIGAEIEALGVERGHRTLAIVRNGGKTVTIPPRPAPPAQLTWPSANGPPGRPSPPGDGRLLDRHGAAGIVCRVARRAVRGAPSSRSVRHAATRVHPRRPRRRGAAALRAGSSIARRPAYDYALRPARSLLTVTPPASYPPT